MGTAKSARQLEREVEAYLRGGSLDEATTYHPGGRGGGGSARGKGTAVVKPHAMTSPSCKLCRRYHTLGECRRHGGPVAKKKAGTKKAATPRKARKAKKVNTRKPATRKKTKAATRTPATATTATTTRPEAAPNTTLRIVWDAIPKIGAGGRAGNRASSDKVYIAAVWDATKSRTRMSLDEFKRWLIDQLRLGTILLSRGDIRFPDEVKLYDRSEIEDRGATFHFINDRDMERRQRSGGWI